MFSLINSNVMMIMEQLMDTFLKCTHHSCAILIAVCSRRYSVYDAGRTRLLWASYGHVGEGQARVCSLVERGDLILRERVGEDAKGVNLALKVGPFVVGQVVDAKVVVIQGSQWRVFSFQLRHFDTILVDAPISHSAIVTSVENPGIMLPGACRPLRCKLLGRWCVTLVSSNERCSWIIGDWICSKRHVIRVEAVNIVEKVEDKRPPRVRVLVLVPEGNWQWQRVGIELWDLCPCIVG